MHAIGQLIIPSFSFAGQHLRNPRTIPTCSILVHNFSLIPGELFAHCIFLNIGHRVEGGLEWYCHFTIPLPTAPLRLFCLLTWHCTTTIFCLSLYHKVSFWHGGAIVWPFADTTIMQHGALYFSDITASQRLVKSLILFQKYFTKIAFQ